MIVLATQNENKLREIAALPAAAGLELAPISRWPAAPDVLEDGVSCEENAAIKAVRSSLWLKRTHDLVLPVLAEDSGLAVEALLGWPGVESKRVAATDPQRIEEVLKRMEGHSFRSAHFVAHTALAVNGRLVRTWRGTTPGVITDAPRGSGGFGYDPIFLDQELQRTFAELTSEEKNARSHRGKAWEQALAFVRVFERVSDAA